MSIQSSNIQVETHTYYKATFRTDHVSCPVVLHQLCIGVIGALHLGKRVSTETQTGFQRSGKIYMNYGDMRKQLFVCGLGYSKQYRKMPNKPAKTI